MPMTRAAWVQQSGWLARAVLAGVFLFAGWPKVLDPSGFAAAIDNYHLLPEVLVRVTATALPLLEIAVAIGLLWPALARGASMLAIALLCAFSVAMIQAMARDIDLDCGCFGTSTELGVNGWSVDRNLGLCSLACWSLWTLRVPQTSAPVTLTES
jgi:putative oxidoreductase